MASERKFIKKAKDDIAIKTLLEHELGKAGISRIELQKTPVATRISIAVRKPGMVVGKRGSAIKSISDMLTQRFKIENPQIEVIEVARPELDAKLVAEKIGRQIEMQGKTKQVMRFAMQDVTRAGAIGCEIRVAGKLAGKGAKAKTFKVRSGYLKKSGYLMKMVDHGTYVAYTKAGAIGVDVRIVQPGTVFPDQVRIGQVVIPQDLLDAPVPVIAAELKLDEAAVEAKIQEAKDAAEKALKPKKPRAPRKKKDAAPANAQATIPAVANHNHEAKTDAPAATQ